MSISQIEMKVVVYSTRPYEKEFIAIANHKKHDITLISNPLTSETIFYASGKDAVVVNTDDDVSENIINNLADFGIKYISTRSHSTTHINQVAAKNAHLKIGHLSQKCSSYDESDAISPTVLQEIAEETIHNLDQWQQNKCLGKNCLKNCEIKNNSTDTSE